MPLPTKFALAKKPAALVMISYLATDPDKVAVRDYEWLETDEGRKQFWAEMKTWCAEDVMQSDDTLWVIVNVKDTAAVLQNDPAGLDGVHVYAPDNTVDDAWIQARIKEVLDNPVSIVAPAPDPKPQKPKTPKVKAEVKGRGKGVAADAIKGPIEPGRAPRPKAKDLKVKARKGAVSPSQIPDVLKGTTAEDKAKDQADRAARLKERLQEKQTQDVEQQAAADEAKVEKALADSKS